ncbi:hypothetical protein LZ31DRAFT_89144 [Colletotrichum somersetense]|nr:hypothetical protein LZ31DRAFT_89144 [Colletotrichum somersetense]
MRLVNHASPYLIHLLKDAKQSWQPLRPSVICRFLVHGELDPSSPSLFALAHGSLHGKGCKTRRLARWPWTASTEMTDKRRRTSALLPALLFPAAMRHVQMNGSFEKKFQPLARPPPFPPMTPRLLSLVSLFEP